MIFLLSAYLYKFHLKSKVDKLAFSVKRSYFYIMPRIAVSKQKVL